jgi:serine protease Do
MRASACLLLLALLPPAAGRADEERPASPLKALNAAVKKAVARAGPSVARVLVSRSDSYHKAPYWGVPPAGEPGRLGGFDAKAAAAKVPEDVPNRARALRAIRDHDLSDPAVVPESFGTGIVLHDSGLVLTCAHVVRNATKVYVRLPDGRGSWADVHASDPRSDLAVLRLVDKLPGLKALKLGPAAGVRKGDFVISLLHPSAPAPRADGPDASWGLVSGLRRRAPGNLNDPDRAKITLHHYGTLIAFDARHSPACSGGLLLNLDGEPVGLINVLAGLRGSDRPGGYAIPLAGGMRRVVDTLARGEEVEYGFLGVVPQTNFRTEAGAGIRDVSPGSPAHRAGLRPGHRVVSIDGKPVRGNEDLFLLIGLSPPGTTVKVQVEGPRDGQRETKHVTLAKFYVPDPGIASRRPPARGGLRVDWLSLLSQRAPFPFLRQPLPARGVLIREVLPGSPADKAHLQPDKVITHVGPTPVNTPAEYYKAMAGAKGTVELTVLSSDGARSEKVKIDVK